MKFRIIAGSLLVILFVAGMVSSASASPWRSRRHAHLHNHNEKHGWYRYQPTQETRIKIVQVQEPDRYYGDRNRPDRYERRVNRRGFETRIRNNSHVRYGHRNKW